MAVIREFLGCVGNDEACAGGRESQPYSCSVSSRKAIDCLPRQRISKIAGRSSMGMVMVWLCGASNKETAQQATIGHVLTHPEEAREVGRLARQSGSERYNGEAMHRILPRLIESEALMAKSRRSRG
jgi:hypothetical protein